MDIEEFFRAFGENCPEGVRIRDRRLAESATAAALKEWVAAGFCPCGHFHDLLKLGGMLYVILTATDTAVELRFYDKQNRHMRTMPMAYADADKGNTCNPYSRIDEDWKKRQMEEMLLDTLVEKGHVYVDVENRRISLC